MRAENDVPIGHATDVADINCPKSRTRFYKHIKLWILMISSQLKKMLVCPKRNDSYNECKISMSTHSCYPPKYTEITFCSTMSHYCFNNIYINVPRVIRARKLTLSKRNVVNNNN